MQLQSKNVKQTRFSRKNFQESLIISQLLDIWYPTSDSKTYLAGCVASPLHRPPDSSTSKISLFFLQRASKSAYCKWRLWLAPARFRPCSGWLNRIPPSRWHYLFPRFPAKQFPPFFPSRLHKIALRLTKMSSSPALPFDSRTVEPPCRTPADHAAHQPKCRFSTRRIN